ncbi:hypothetical protein [Paraburkholderia sp. J10-1]|uniref:hypothetical protein n=1 Tax=Paraburkholderia sp. J10-1 TaxID=2805430 RepID=UPI002AB710CD|nr:hypothetical protein [Paraburkholderia sp. J10-1]
MAYNSPHTNVVSFPAGKRVDSGGGGGDDQTMEARVKALEDANFETRDRLARIETRLDITATKADLSDLRVELHKAINAQTWKFVTYVATICSALVAATYFLVNHGH